jgi:hypothetical protein
MYRIYHTSIFNLLRRINTYQCMKKSAAVSSMRHPERCSITRQIHVYNRELWDWIHLVINNRTRRDFHRTLQWDDDKTSSCQPDWAKFSPSGTIRTTLSKIFYKRAYKGGKCFVQGIILYAKEMVLCSGHRLSKRLSSR